MNQSRSPHPCHFAWCLLLALGVSASFAADRKSVTLNVLAGLQFDLTRFAVEPGTKVSLTLNNNDPTDQAHNVVIANPGTRLAIVQASLELGSSGPALDYIPKSKDVLWTIPLLTAGQKQTIEFVAPKKKGVYPYICTFPGHGFIMYGAMYVGVKMPPKDQDPNIPKIPALEVKEESKQGDYHAFPFTRPTMYRMFMKDAGPAAIAVALPGDQNFCWDADGCRLRYAWQGDFLDPNPYWRANGNGLANILGTKYYSSNAREGESQFIVNGKRVKPDFKGYRMIAGIPQFEYGIGGAVVREYIQPSATGKGLTWQFEISNASGKIQVEVPAHDDVSFDASAGSFNAGILTLTASEAKAFTITMTRTGGVK